MFLLFLGDSFSIPENSSDAAAMLKVYNTLGQEVAPLLTHATIESGVHEFTFDATNLSRGVYFC